MQIATVQDISVSTSGGRHFYQFYRGREDLFHIVVPFLRLGLENKEACLWVVSQTTGIMEAIKALQRQCEISRYIENGQFLIIPAERWYLDQQRFSVRRVFAKLNKFIDDKRRLGYSSFRGVGDVGLIEPKNWRQFQTYESKVHPLIHRMKITAICAYPIQQCSLTQTKEVLDHHDGVFLTKL